MWFFQLLLKRVLVTVVKFILSIACVSPYSKGVFVPIISHGVLKLAITSFSSVLLFLRSSRDNFLTQKKRLLDPVVCNPPNSCTSNFSKNCYIKNTFHIWQSHCYLLLYSGTENVDFFSNKWYGYCAEVQIYWNSVIFFFFKEYLSLCWLLIKWKRTWENGFCCWGYRTKSLFYVLSEYFCLWSF